MRPALFAALLLLAAPAALASRPTVRLEVLGSWPPAPTYRPGAAEIVTHDPLGQRLFVVNAAEASVDALDLADPAAPALLFSIDLAPFGGHPTSVAVHDGVLAVALPSDVETDPGSVVLFDTDGALLAVVQVGVLPDMLAFTHNGRWLLTADEGQPSEDYTLDPPGSVSIVDLGGGAAAVGQEDVRTVVYDGAVPPGVRIFGPGASVAQDLEPEYLVTSHDSRTAWVVFQENNAVGVLDIAAGRFEAVLPLGTKDHAVPGQGLDPSDRDGAARIATWPVQGLYQPDGMSAFRAGGRTFIATANEGDSRNYGGYSEEARVGDAAYVLDPTVFPDAAALKASKALGRLKVTTASGDLDGDGDFDRIHVYGARSFSIWDEDMQLVWDSGDDFEQVILAEEGAWFDSDHETAGFDKRSAAKGPEPEYVVTGRVFGRTYAVVGLERQSGLMVYDVSDPYAPAFVQYASNRDFTVPQDGGEAGDLGPEGLKFIPAGESPNGAPLLVTANEVSGTVTVWVFRQLGR